MITCPIAIGARETPNALAIKENENLYTYKDLEGLTCRYCLAIQTYRFDEKTIVAFPANRNSKTIAFFFALMRLKMIACPLNPKLPKTSLDDHLLELGRAVFLKPEELALHSCGYSIKEMEIKKTSLLLFTSGSSGFPKIAAFSLENLLYSAFGVIETVLLDEKSKWLLSLPLFHVSGIGILFRSFLAKSAILILQEKLELCIEKESITHLSLVPTQLYRLKKKEYPFLEAILLGGAPIPEYLFNEHCKTKPLLPTYGMTEMSSTITLNEERGHFHLGKCLPYRNLKVSPDGEIVVKGKPLFQGYWRNNQITLPLDKEGFFATSDLGKFHNGNLVFLGRKDFMFISGGENITPEEIEKHIYDIEGVHLAIVVPVPDEEFGMRPVAFIKKESLNENEIRKKLEGTLPKFKVPSHYFKMPEIQGLKPCRNHLKKLAGEFLNTQAAR